MAVLITEAVALDASKSTSGRIRIKIIDEGVGSSGTYPAKTLENAAKDKVFAKGLHMYADHPTALESMDRPERTIKDLMGVLETDAVFEDGALYADAKVFPQWREVVTEMADDIGMSIRASAEVEEANGERMITRLVSAESVDFVTKAGRGGKVMEVLESARAVKSAIGHGVSEATANDTREWLQSAVRSTHAEGEREYAWVRDFDEANVWFEKSGEDGEQLYQQGYTISGNTAELTGEPIRVRIETRYVPVAPATEAATDSPPIPAGVHENQEEATMATIDDKELATLRESAGRATVAESELTTATERATTAEAALQESNDSAAASLVTAALAEAGITAPKTAARLSKGYPVKENGALDTEAFTADVAESIAELAEANGAGTVRGVGDTTGVTESKTITDDDVVNAL